MVIHMPFVTDFQYSVTVGKTTLLRSTFFFNIVVSCMFFNKDSTKYLNCNLMYVKMSDIAIKEICSENELMFCFVW